MSEVDQLSQRLQSRGTSLTSSQRRVGDFVLRHRQEVALLTAQELADKVDVSAATVVRFAQAIGFSGYPEFRRNMQEALRSGFDVVRRLRDSESYAEGPEWMKAYGDIVIRTLDELDYGSLLSAAEIISRSTGHVYVLGYRGSFHVASLLAMRLTVIRGGVLAVDMDQSTHLDMLLHATSDDSIVALSHYRYDQVMASRLEVVADKVGTVTLIGADALSACANLADHIVPVYASAPPPPSPFAVFGPLILACEILVAALCDRNHSAVLESFEEAEKLWSRLGVYEL